MKFIKENKITILIVLVLIAYFVICPLYSTSPAAWFLAPVLLYFVYNIYTIRANQKVLDKKLNELKKQNEETLKKFYGNTDETEEKNGNQEESNTSQQKDL